MEIDEKVKEKNQLIMVILALLIIVFLLVTGLIISRQLKIKTGQIENLFSNIFSFFKKEFFNEVVDKDFKFDFNLQGDSEGTDSGYNAKNSKSFSFDQEVSLSSKTEFAYYFKNGNIEINTSGENNRISGYIDYSGNDPKINFEKSFVDRLEIFSNNNNIKSSYAKLPLSGNIVSVSASGSAGNLTLALSKSRTDNINASLESGNINIYFPESEYSLAYISLNSGNIILNIPKNQICLFEFAKGIPDFDFGSGYIKTDKSVKDKGFDGYLPETKKSHIYINQSSGNFVVKRY